MAKKNVDGIEPVEPVITPVDGIEPVEDVKNPTALKVQLTVAVRWMGKSYIPGDVVTIPFEQAKEFAPYSEIVVE